MNSKIIMCKGIKMDREYNNVLSYDEEGMQRLVNNSTFKVAEASNYSFVGGYGNNVVLVDFAYDLCIKSNYIAFQNPNYSNKWFYAWIDDVEYVSDKNTRIRFTIDNWSTWFSLANKLPCYVEREHVNSDNIGEHIVEENLDIGETIQISGQNYTLDASNGEENMFFVAVETNYTPNYYKGDYNNYSGAFGYNKEIFGSQIVLFPIITDTDADFTSSLNNIGGFIKRCELDSNLEQIKQMFIVPLKIGDLMTGAGKAFVTGDSTSPRNRIYVFITKYVKRCIDG